MSVENRILSSSDHFPTDEVQGFNLANACPRLTYGDRAGVRGLTVRKPGFSQSLKTTPCRPQRKHEPLHLYWNMALTAVDRAPHGLPSLLSSQPGSGLWGSCISSHSPWCLFRGIWMVAPPLESQKGQPFCREPQDGSLAILTPKLLHKETRHEHTFQEIWPGELKTND